MKIETPELTVEEQLYISKGGRVFIINETPDHFWRVLIVKENSCKAILDAEWISMDRALEVATATAMLSGDNPLIRAPNRQGK